MSSPALSKACLAQAELLHALLQPPCYPHPVEVVECIETHISTVLLAGAYAYKFKKPVNLGFLDFSTLELRRRCCEEELRLNQRLSPQLYFEVVAVIGSPEAPRVVAVETPEASAALEYAVKMRRFEQSELLDHMLAADVLTVQQLDALAQAVATFHSTIAIAKAVGETASYGTPEQIAVPMLENFHQIRPLLTDAGEHAVLNELERWSIATHTTLVPSMAERKQAGFVRECHGDLHLGNITWVEGAIQIFDCIEFNPRLRWIDVVSEIAFTVMDLAARGRPEWGARFLNTYLEITGDYTGLSLLSYYLVYRAMVRAKVSRLRAAQTEGEVRRAALADYANYSRLACSFTLARQPALLLTHGVSGSGKSTAVQPLVEQLGAIQLRSDVERKRLHGLSREARSNSATQAGLYTENASQTTYAELRRLASLILQAGYPVIVDATFLRRHQRDTFRALAAELRLPFLIIDCHAELAELQRRVELRQAAATDASEATLLVLERQLQTEEKLSESEMSNVMMFNTLHDLPTDIVTRVHQWLETCSKSEN